MSAKLTRNHTKIKIGGHIDHPLMYRIGVPVDDHGNEVGIIRSQLIKEGYMVRSIAI